MVVQWSAGLATAIDVATGGSHVARRLREAGLQVVSCDPSPGMQPDVICFAEDLPFADASFELAVTRVAAHHFVDVGAAVRELARVASKRVVVVDNLFMGEAAEEAERLRDPSHVRNYSEAEWRGFFADAGLTVDEVRTFDFPIELEPWLAAHRLRRRRRRARARAARGPDPRWRCRARPDRAPRPGGLSVAILVDRDTRLVVQGLTGSEGRFFGLRNRDYGTNVVAGVTPGKGGQDVDGIPVFDTVAAAVEATGANATLVFVPARFAADAVYEAADAGIATAICIAATASPRTTCSASRRTCARAA